MTRRPVDSILLAAGAAFLALGIMFLAMSSGRNGFLGVGGALLLGGGVLLIWPVFSRDRSPHQSDLKVFRYIRAFQADPAGQMARQKWYPIAGCMVGVTLLLSAYLSVRFSDIDPRWSILIAALGGAAISWAAFVLESLRRWPAISSLIDPERVEKRQSDLEA